LLWSVPGEVDDRLKAAAAERGEIPVAIAAQLFDLWKEVRVPPTAVEEDDFMPARKRSFDNVPTEEKRPAEDQDSHARGSRLGV
jgi:hypothetical protein